LVWHASHGRRPIADVVWCGEEDGLMQSVLLKVPFTIAITLKFKTKNKNVGSAITHGQRRIDKTGQDNIMLQGDRVNYAQLDCFNSLNIGY